MILFLVANGLLRGKVSDLEARQVTLLQAAKSASAYHKLYGLCEMKYQAGIAGDFAKAYQIKGEMTQVEQALK